MAWILLAIEVVVVMIAGNYLWIRAVRSVAPEFKHRDLGIWFMGPLFSRREQFTAEGLHWRRLANAAGWGGLLLFAITAILLFR